MKAQFKTKEGTSNAPLNAINYADKNGIHDVKQLYYYGNLTWAKPYSITFSDEDIAHYGIRDISVTLNSNNYNKEGRDIFNIKSGDTIYHGEKINFSSDIGYSYSIYVEDNITEVFPTTQSIIYKIENAKGAKPTVTFSGVYGGFTINWGDKTSYRNGISNVQYGGWAITKSSAYSEDNYYITIDMSEMSYSNGMVQLSFDKEVHITRIIQHKNAPITSLKESYMKDNTYLKSVVLSEKIGEIPNSAFSGCISLSKINIPDGTVIIGAAAFKDCSALSEIILPDSIRNVGVNAFQNCNLLSEITVSNSNAVVGQNALLGCTNISKLTLPRVGTNLYDEDGSSLGYLFGANTPSDNYSIVPSSLKTVIITGGDDIPSQAFYLCRDIKNIILPDTLLTIHQQAFENCYYLKNITLPNSLITIGKDAFHNCYELTELILPDSVKAILSKLGISPSTFSCYPYWKITNSSGTFYSTTVSEVYHYMKGYAAEEYRFDRLDPEFLSGPVIRSSTSYVALSTKIGIPLPTDKTAKIRVIIKEYGNASTSFKLSKLIETNQDGVEVTREGIGTAYVYAFVEVDGKLRGKVIMGIPSSVTNGAPVIASLEPGYRLAAGVKDPEISIVKDEVKSGIGVSYYNVFVTNPNNFSVTALIHISSGSESVEILRETRTLQAGEIHSYRYNCTSGKTINCNVSFVMASEIYSYLNTSKYIGVQSSGGVGGNITPALPDVKP